MWTGIIFIVATLLHLSGGQGVQNLRKIYEADTVLGGEEGNPGMKIRITKKGFTEIKNAFVAALNVELRKLSIARYVVPGTGQYEIILSEMSITEYTPASSSNFNLAPPNQVRMIVNGINARLKGKFTGGLGAAKASGTFTGFAKGLNIDVSLMASRAGPSLTTKVSSCKSSITSADFDVNVPGIIGAFIKQRKDHIGNVFREKLPQIVCQLMNHVVADLGAALVADAPTLTPIELVEPGKFPKPAPPHIQVLETLQTNLKMDNSLTEEIFMNNEYAETRHRGEIRYEDGLDSGLPFYPESVEDTPKTMDRSLYVTGTEYVLNSFMFHAYRRDKLDLKIAKEMLPKGAKNFLDTSCKKTSPLKLNEGLKGLQSVCIGRFIPALATNYPNNHTSFKIVPLGIPQFQMRDESCYLNLTARIMTLIDQGWRELPVLVSRANVIAKSDYELETPANRFVGKLKLNKFDMKVHRSGLKGLDPSNIESLGPISKGILGKELKETAKQGIQLPKFKLFKLRRPVFKVGQGYGQLQSDIIIDQVKLEEIVGAAMRRGSAAVG